MSLVLLGILNQQLSGAAPQPALEHIATLTSGTSTTSLTFSGLDTYASEYKHLRLMAVRSIRFATIQNEFMLRFNGSTSGYANMGFHVFLPGSRLEPYSTSYTNGIIMQVSQIQDPNGSSTWAGTTVMDIPDWTANKNKEIYQSGLSSIAETNWIQMEQGSGLWANSSAITSITIAARTAGRTLGQNTQYALFGIRG